MLIRPVAASKSDCAALVPTVSLNVWTEVSIASTDVIVAYVSPKPANLVSIFWNFVLVDSTNSL